MERNWLIRTSQNQILGPVTKQKLLEFVQKGSLGMLDEVSSGNGYWFYLKEKDLVDKYIYGDLTQGYNTISESKSVLSKRDNPEKTTSINSTPANHTSLADDRSSDSSTQIIKLDFEVLNNLIPKEADLARPNSVANENVKIPDQDDLEFPDVELIASAVNASFDGGDLAIHASLTSAKIPMPIPKPTYSLGLEPESPTENLILPSEDDLAFPDMDDIKTSPKIEKGKVDLSHQYTRTVALDAEQSASVLSLEKADDNSNLTFEVTLDVKKNSLTEEEVSQVDNLENKGSVAIPLKLDRNNSKISNLGAMPVDNIVNGRSSSQNDDKKLLHDRRPRPNISKGAAQRDPSRENHPKDTNTESHKRNDNYIFFILIIFALILMAVFFYFKEILNKPLPM